MLRVHQSSTRLNVVVLENRDTPANFLVNNAAWSANTPNSLPWAVAQANSTNGEDVITINRDDVATSAALPDGSATITANKSTLTVTEAVRIMTTVAGQRVTISGRGDEGKKSVLVFNLGPTRDPNQPPGGGGGPVVTVREDIPGGGGAGGGGAGGGALPVARLTDINFERCDSTRGNGAAIAVAAGTVFVEDAKFANNETHRFLEDDITLQYNGGAIAVQAGALLQIAGNVAFTDNFAATRGGAIWTEGNVAVLNSGNSFSKNFAQYGGAIASGGNGIVSVYGASFTENSASTQGGAMWLDSATPGGTHIISRASFKGNFIDINGLFNADGHGGAIYISNGKLAISRTD